MRVIWLLVLLPNLCLAKIVQIDDLVKKDKSYPVGTPIHESLGRAFEPQMGMPYSEYGLTPVFRYVFAGVQQEGKKEFIKIEVQNLFLEKVVRENLSEVNNSKQGPARPGAPIRSTTITLLAPVQNGHAQFWFPNLVATASRTNHMDVSEAILEVKDGRMVVREVAQRVLPADNLPWTPPREWPTESKTFYLDGSDQGPATGTAAPLFRP